MWQKTKFQDDTLKNLFLPQSVPLENMILKISDTKFKILNLKYFIII